MMDTVPASSPIIYHNVTPGDTLESIATRYYGRGTEWPRIWNANRDVLGARLKAGQQIRIPK